MEFIAEQSNIRVDKYLAEKIPSISRTKLQSAIKIGALKVNEVEVKKTSQRLKAGDRVTLLEDRISLQNGEIKIMPEEMPLEVVYEDNDIAVINKPAGLLVHPTPTHREHTLANALLAKYPEIVAVGENPMRPGIVHRLDKETSGLIIVAKNQKAFEFIKEQFLNRKVKKIYLALIEGIPPEREGEISYDIRPSKYNRLKKVAVKKVEPMKKSRRSAATKYKVIKNIDDDFALLEVMPLTGRTHQIRVHLAAIGHPIAGDYLYGAKKEKARELGLKRIFLHAYSLEFVKLSGKPIKLVAELADELSGIARN